jgi:hypothetical protein
MISKVIDLNVDEHMNGASNSKGIDVRKGAMINNNYDTLFKNYYHDVMHMMYIQSSNGSTDINSSSSVAAAVSVNLIYLHTVCIAFISHYHCTAIVLSSLVCCS